MNRALCAQIMMELATTTGLTYLVPVRLTFRPRTSWEIGLSFKLPGDEPVARPVSRELLLDGLSTVAGDGAIRVSPCTRRHDMVAIEFSSPRKATRLIAPATALHTYLLRTDALRPMGTEFDEAWLERGITSLLRSTKPRN